MSTKMKGIDVSYAQGDIDFQQVKDAGIDFVIIRAGWGAEKIDDWYERNYQKATDAGLYVGAYWYCYGTTMAEIEKEADAFIKALEGKQFEFPVYMDLEEKSQFDLSKEFCSDAVRAFCGKLEKAGYFAGLYTSTSFLDSVIDDDVKKKYTLWVADWRGYCGYNGEYGMWQYGAGYVPGINGKTDYNVLDMGYDTDYPGSVVKDGVDLDYAYEDFPMEIVLGGYNNFPKPEVSEPVSDDCKNISSNIDIQGITPAKIQDNWLLIDTSGKFTLTPLAEFKANLYLVGGGEDGAEWQKIDVNGYQAYDIEKKCRGGCVLKMEIDIKEAVQCQAVIAQRNNTAGTTLKIGNEIYKCTDKGYVQRRATTNGSAKRGAYSNGESGANGIKTPYGYVGSSGGGGGTYSSINGDIITVYAGKGGNGAGDGGDVKNSGTDAVNYGCGGGSAGFGGFPSKGETVETHAGKGKGGCIIIEIISSDTCNSSSDTPSGDGGSSSGSYNPCCCPHHEFTCPNPSTSSSASEQETSYKLTYVDGKPVETENSSSYASPDSNNSGETSNITGSSSSSSCDCSHNSSSHSCGGSSCGCGSSGSGNRTRCVSLDVEKWGTDWLLFNKSGKYSLTVDEDITLKIYLVGGGSDGQDGIYFSGTSYGGNGGRGGCYAVVSDIKIAKGQLNIEVKVGRRGEYNGTSVIINNTEYCCNAANSSANDGGVQGICGKNTYQQAGNGTNGIETPFGYIGSSGGGGAAYYNTETTGRGQGGLYAGNGAKIISGKATHGDKAVGYGCGGGGGSATSTSWCEGGKGKQGCVIFNWQRQPQILL